MSDQQYGQQPGNYGQQGYYDPQTGQYVQQYGQQQGYYDPQGGQYYQQQAAYNQQGQYWQQPVTHQPQYPPVRASGNTALKVMAVITLLFGLAFLAFNIITMFVGPIYKNVFSIVGSAFKDSTVWGLYYIAHILKLIFFFLSGILLILAGIFALVGSVKAQKLKTAKTFTSAAVVAQVFAFVSALAILLLALLGKAVSGFDATIWDVLKGSPLRTYTIVELAALAFLGLIFILVLKSMLKRAKTGSTTAQQQPYYGYQYYQQPPQGYGAQQQYYNPQTQYTGQNYTAPEAGSQPENQ